MRGISGFTLKQVHALFTPMLELLLYEYSFITDTQYETPSMQICIDGCFDPNDQDHYGQNFNLQIKGDGKLLYDNWSNEEHFDDFYHLFKSLGEPSVTKAKVYPDCDEVSIILQSNGEFINFTIIMNHFIVAHNTVVFPNLLINRKQYENFMKDFDKLMKLRKKRDIACGFST